MSMRELAQLPFVPKKWVCPANTGERKDITCVRDEEQLSRAFLLWRPFALTSHRFKIPFHGRIGFKTVSFDYIWFDTLK